jgi:AcrR family transcriptional regulator
MSANLENPTVRRILVAARECFGRGGFHGTSLREVAQAAGVSKALIHYHFENKETLLLELERDVHREIAEEIRQISLDRQPGLECAADALDKLAESIVSFQHLVPVFLELAAVAVRREDLGLQVQSFFHEATRIVETAIYQTLGDEASQLRVPPRRLASLILAWVQGVALGAYPGNEAQTAQRLRDFKEILLAGLLADGDSAAAVAARSERHEPGRT